ncbi:MAG: helix-turn-helix domain-containing protein [Oscillospiraceae bacterium]|nr:helix-turn-helix domain-containing protein [Oscillospiraceae bacterium]
MASKKYPLLPIEVIEKAVTGEPEAMDTVLRHYAGYIKYLSMYQGHFNSDIEDRLKAKLINAILQFRFDR